MLREIKENIDKQFNDRKKIMQEPKEKLSKKVENFKKNQMSFEPEEYNH